MAYRVLLIKTEEGFAAFCPALPGCVSQGTNEAEAMENVRDAIALWLDAGGTPAQDGATAAETELRREAATDGLTVVAREIELTAAV